MHLLLAAKAAAAQRKVDIAECLFIGNSTS